MFNRPHILRLFSKLVLRNDGHGSLSLSDLKDNCRVEVSDTVKCKSHLANPE